MAACFSLGQTLQIKATALGFLLGYTNGMGQLVALDSNCYGAMPLFSNVFHISTILMEFHLCDSRLDVIL